MITPRQDKEAIKAVLDTDPFIERNGFKSANIQTTRASSDIVNVSNPEYQIHISLGTPENSGSEIVKNSVYTITISGKRSTSGRIDDVAYQVIALLDRLDIGRGHTLYSLDPPLELQSDPSIYIVETTFLCQGTNFNVVRK